MNEWKHSVSLLNGWNTMSYLFTCVMMVSLALGSGEAIAQPDTGTISGTVSANEEVDVTKYVMLLQETNDVTPISETGEFIFEEVPEGNYTLIFRTTDEVIEEVSITVVSGEMVEQHFDLTTVALQGESVKTEAREIDGTGFTLNSEQIVGFGDYSVEEAMARIPGVQVARDGDINLRGVGYKSYYVTVNGQRMGTTGLGDRNADLGAISTDMISEVEFIKVLTPDMFADGLAGVVNLKTYNPAEDESEIIIGMGGGANPAHFNRTGATGRAWARVIQPLSDDISIAMNFSYQQNQTVSEVLGIEYGLADFGNGNVDVIEQVSPALQTEERGRLGGSVQLDYTPNETSSFYLQGMVNTDSRERIRHRNNWLANGSWENQFTTGPQGSFRYDLRNEYIDISQFTFKAGGQHLFDPIILEYSAGWAQSEINKNEYHFPFEMSGMEYTINLEDQNRPMPEVVEDPQIEDMMLSDMTYIIDQHIDRTYSGNIDVEIPFGLGSFKIGTSALITNKDANEEGAYNEYLYTYPGFLNLNEFEHHEAGQANLLGDQYSLDWVLDSEEALSFFEASIPNLRLDRDLNNRTSNIWNYLASEKIYAGYGMATLNFGSLTFIGGARIEHTAADYEGRTVRFNRFDQFEESTDTSVVSSYTNIFPHTQLIFDPSEESSIRLAYSRSIARPDFNLIAPFELITPADTSIFRGNPGLEPIVSDNFDLFLDQSIMETGVVSVGAFYKRLTNFISEESRTIQASEGDFIPFDEFFDDETTEISVSERSFHNEEETAAIYGVEVAWQQRLLFLPGLLRNLGTYANYTWSNSSYTSSRGEETAFPGQRPHVVNAALDYSQDRFSAQISYHWSAESLNKLAQERTEAPSVSSDQVYMDRYQEGFQDLSASLKYKLSNEIQLWANVYNLMQSEEVGYRYNRDNYPTSIYQRDGIEFSLGVQLNF